MQTSTQVWPPILGLAAERSQVSASYPSQASMLHSTIYHQVALKCSTNFYANATGGCNMFLTVYFDGMGLTDQSDVEVSAKIAGK